MLTAVLVDRYGLPVCARTPLDVDPDGHATIASDIRCEVHGVCAWWNDEWLCGWWFDGCGYRVVEAGEPLTIAVPPWVRVPQL